MNWFIGIVLALLALCLVARYIFKTAVRLGREDDKRANDERSAAYRLIYRNPD